MLVKLFGPGVFFLKFNFLNSYRVTQNFFFYNSKILQMILHFKLLGNMDYIPCAAQDVLVAHSFFFFKCWMFLNISFKYFIF